MKEKAEWLYNRGIPFFEQIIQCLRSSPEKQTGYYQTIFVHPSLVSKFKFVGKSETEKTLFPEKGVVGTDERSPPSQGILDY